MTTPDCNWGEIIADTINFGREDRSSKCKKIRKFDLGYAEFTHCCHVMIYAKTKTVFENFPRKAIILMQMRYDGLIGFPGGTANKQETPLDCLYRKTTEELGWKEVKDFISDSNYKFTYLDEENELVLHFYAVEVTETKMEELERNSLKASAYGQKVLGHFRVPLYVMGDAFRGFPAFLKNHFVGISKLQFIEAITSLNLLTEEQITQALYSAPRITL